MGENAINVIEISPSSSEKVRDSGTGIPISHILCLKNANDIKLFEESEECFILDFDPFDPIDISKLSVSEKPAAGDGDDDDDGNDNDDDADFVVLAEKGQVACRDYPHSRHLCMKFPFETSSHESFCEQCYCYVCDSPAPCSSWTEPKPAHCHASEQDGNWKFLRKMMKQRPEV
ncbi:hypothetical protein PanWU01x14_067910 [Parasponia andersonii]|uniref:Uncharacterized protein n=1 Tax=Parasponia andersonii TaxID=3476 RepID=A0A2P5DF81_PARAD|nr:hypothetical protein PanWU01x14_067910 [Parasponia andersonii]